MSSDVTDWQLIISFSIVILCVIIRALLAASGKALDFLDRSTVKEMRSFESSKEPRINSVLFLTEHPNKYRYANTIITYILLIICFLLLNTNILNSESVKTQLISNALFILIWLIIAEFFPTRLAVQISEICAIRLVRFQKVFCIIAWPFVKISVILSNIILVILRKETDVDDIHFSEDKIKSMIDRGTEVGELKEEANKMIDSIFEFDDLLAYEIMTPRTDVFMIDIEDDRDEYYNELMELKYSRIPVCDGDSDNIIGILHIKDYLLMAINVGFENVDIKSILREAHFVPETKNIDTLFVELQKKKQHMAILIDEYGGFSGIVTLEDLIEQIVGDIDDEFDEEDRIIKKIDSNTFVVDGKVYLDDLGEETGVYLESSTSETIGGYLIDLMGEVPKENENYSPIVEGNCKFSILSVKDHRIEKIKIEINSDKKDDAKIN